MDWRHYSDAASRENDKVYDDIQVDKWEIKDNQLIPVSSTSLQEKARYINSDKGTNKYNITQTIAETFGVFCTYEYKSAANGEFIKTYIDEKGRNMTGRTAVFYNRAIKTDEPFVMDYQKNLQSISRTCDSSEIYTKLFVDSIQSETMTDGYITIANTEANPLMDEFILNFDYLYSKGSITEYQKNFVEEYSVELHEINKKLRDYGEQINTLTAEINDKKAERAMIEKSISAIQEELTHYETLRDNDVTNTPITKDSSNSYSVVFVNENATGTGSPYYKASIRLEGVLSGSIKGYKNYKYETMLFSSEDLVLSKDFKTVSETDPNMYVVLDDDDYAIGLYTSNAEWFETEDIESDYSLNAGYLIYLSLQYSPHNKYVEVCNRFERMITKNQEQMDTYEKIINNQQAKLDNFIEEQNKLLSEKNLLNQKLEHIMGPALREGHWTAKDYEDIGKKTEVKVGYNIKETDETELFFDTELFEGEEKGYYYTSVEDAANSKKTYYDYIDISSYIATWKDQNPEDLVIHLTHPEFKYTVTDSQYNGILKGKYFILYNMIKYYFTLQNNLVAGDTLRLLVSTSNQLSLQVSTNKEATWTNIPLTITVIEEDEKNYSNLSDIFEGLNKYLGVYKIYPNAGFIYSFIYLDDGTIKPILLLNNSEINYSNYKQIGHSFGNEEIRAITLHNYWHHNQEFTICYPRIKILKNNVNYDDDQLAIIEEGTKEPLTKFEDYSILLRKGHPYFNLKMTQKTSPYDVLNKNYSLFYRVSQANEMLYRDALEVARENSRPRFSYEVSIAQIPSTVESFELGQLGYINDSLLGVNAAKGYISGITLVLDSPKDDEIEIQNYKTKFEDLFATITASSEAMKSNQRSYDIAASIVNPTGGIEGSILQDSINNNKIELTYSNTSVHMDDTDGIILTNLEPYSNGVFGQVVMRGGGIFLSNSVDSNYKRIWNTGITPNGINASTITTGQLDANLIRIFAGNNLAFQWNSEGLYAYKRDEETNEYLPNTYVKYSDKGLQYLDNGFTAVDLGWDGLAINSQEGALSLTGKNGLILYEGEKNLNETNHVVKLGRFGDNEENFSYGMKLYKKSEETDEDGCHIYTETLTTTNEGQLWLKDYIAVGATELEEDNLNSGCGISGVANEESFIISGVNDSTQNSIIAGDAFEENSEHTILAGDQKIKDPLKAVRFWAGTKFKNRENAPFRVLADGSVYATSLYIDGNSTIDGVPVKDIADSASIYEVKLESSKGLIYNTLTEEKTTLIAQVYKNKLNLISLPDNVVLEKLRCEVSENQGEWTTVIEGNNFPFYINEIVMDSSKKYRILFSYTMEGKTYVSYSEEISFTAVSNGSQGRGVEKIIEYYAASESNLNVPNNWETEMPELSPIKKYLWNYEETFYTDNTSEPTDPIVIGAYGDDGRGIVSITNYYLVTEQNELTDEQFNSSLAWNPIEHGWSEVPQVTTINNRYLWNFEEINYTFGDPQRSEPSIIGTHGETGPQGSSGKDAKSYYLISSANSITRDLNVLSPTEITIQIGVNEGGNNSVLNNIDEFELKLSCQEDNNLNDNPEGIVVTKETNYWLIKISQKYGYGSLVEAINLNLLNNEVNIITQSIPFILGSKLLDLVAVDEQTETLRVADGKVYGKSIVAGSITAREIAAGTITANEIAANTITTDKIAADFDLEIGAGRSINITTDGTFTVASDNFTITDEGDVSLTGKITAEEGEIGGWIIEPDCLYAGSGDNYVALNASSTSNSEYAIWAGDSNPVNADFAVKKDGTVYLKKLIALGEPDDDGVRKETNVNLSNYPFWKLNYATVKSIKIDGDTLTIITTSQSVTFEKASHNIQVAIMGGQGGSGYVGLGAEVRDYKADSSYDNVASISATMTIPVSNITATSEATLVMASGTKSESITLSLGGVYNAGWNAGAGEGYITGFEDGKDTYNPTSIVKMGSDTAQKIVTVKAANSHQDLLTNVPIDASEIYEAGVTDGENKFEAGTYYKGNGGLKTAAGDSVTPRLRILYEAPRSDAAAVIVYDVATDDILYHKSGTFYARGDEITAYTKKTE